MTSNVAFKVQSVPTDQYTGTNCVYVNPSDSKLIGSLTSIAGFLYNVVPDNAIVPSTIAMSSIQRRCVGVTTVAGDSVSVPSNGVKPPPSLIATMTVEVEHVAASKRGGTIDCVEFVKFVQTTFVSQYFREGQLFACLIGSASRFIARVTTIVNVGVDMKHSDSLYGKMSDAAKIIVTVNEKSGIQLTNMTDTQMDAQQQTLVQNFDLENLGIGGLRNEFGQVFRRAFASRIFPASFVKKLGIKHVKGVLLYGPPGTGKTLIARKIGEILNTHPPKIVNGPEVFNKFVGGTEENVRKLFVDAEAEQAAKGDQSKLHLIIFDEFDAICKQRGAVRDSTGVSDNVVNQLLSKIDGVNSLNNVLLIGMTNRLDLIDEAILRPGRFEVHIEIGLADESGRLEIFRIHTRGMRENHVMGSDVSLEELAALTKNYSGAEIEGVVRSATSNAFNRHIDFEHPTETIQASDVHVTREDFMNAIEEVKPAFGQAKDECNSLMRRGVIPYGRVWDGIERKCRAYVDNLQKSTAIASLAVLVEGLVGTGKSAIAAHIAMMSEFPYVKVVTNDDMVGYGEMQKVNIIRKAFEDAYKSNFSVIILDDVERLIEYSQLGGRYSNALLQTLLVLIKRQPPEGKRLLVVGTTSQYEVMQSLELASCFSVNLTVPTLEASSLPIIAQGSNIPFESKAAEKSCVEMMPPNMVIKKLLLILEMSAVQGSNGTRFITQQSFADALLATGCDVSIY